MLPGYGPTSLKEITHEQLAARKRWIATLRSKKYRQLQGALATATGKTRCCLGVACDPEVVGIELETNVRISNNMSGGTQRKGFLDKKTIYSGGPVVEEFEYLLMPQLVAKELGFTDGDVLVDTNIDSGRREHLEQVSALNDGGTSFPEIADILEANYVTPYAELVK